MKRLMQLSFGLILSGNLLAANISLSEGECQTDGLEFNSATGQMEMDVTECLAAGSIWSFEVDAVTKPGYYAPEEKANYAVAFLPFIPNQEAHWEIRAQMPDARFASFQTYDAEGNYVDFIVDNDFAADPGSSNWIDDNTLYPGSEHLSYTVPVYEVENRNEISTDKSGGIIYNARDSADEPQHVIVMRTYFNHKRNSSTKPKDVSEFEWIKRGQVDLPRIFYVVDNQEKPHFTTTEEARSNVDPITKMRLLAVAMDTTGKLLEGILDKVTPTTRLWQNPTHWVMNDLPATTYGKMLTPEEEPILGRLWQQAMKLLPETSGYPNEATRYFVGGINQSFGEVHLTKLKRPSTPEPDHGDIMDDDQYDMRYFSVCLHNALTMFTVQCLEDSDMKTDNDGFVTLVTTNTKSAPIDPKTGKPAANWFEFTSPNNIVFIRHQWPSKNFTQSLVHYGLECRKTNSCSAASLDMQAIENWTGDYYPVSKYCSLNNYKFNSCDRVFTSYQEWLYKKFPRIFKRLYK